MFQNLIDEHYRGDDGKVKLNQLARDLTLVAYDQGLRVYFSPQRVSHWVNSKKGPPDLAGALIENLRNKKRSGVNLSSSDDGE